MMPTATSTLKQRLIELKQRQHVKKRGVILFPFILRKKMSLFINSACALRKTSGLAPMTRTQTGLGSG